MLSVVRVKEFCDDCASGNIDKVTQLLNRFDKGEHIVRAAMFRVDTPIYLAALNNRYKIMELLF